MIWKCKIRTRKFQLVIGKEKNASLEKQNPQYMIAMAKSIPVKNGISYIIVA